jgi:hypothetical protein
LWIRIGDGSGSYSAVITSVNIADGNWHHVVFQIQGDGPDDNDTDPKVWVDGTLVLDVTGYTTDKDSSTAEFGMGYRNPSTGSGTILGNINDVAVWQKQLTTAEVVEIYNSGTPTDLKVDTGNYESADDLIGYWKMGDGDTYPTITDHGGSNDGTMTNMTSGDIVEDVPVASNAFTFTVITTNAGSASDTFVLPLQPNGVIDMDVDWGDGTTDTITVYNQAETTHQYSSTGTYTINITNEVRGWKYDSGGDCLKISDISNWGEFNFTERKTFSGCVNLTCSATDTPTISTSNMQRAFMFCSSFDVDVSAWDISSVTILTECFRGATSFDQNIGGWDIDQVTSFNNIFLQSGLSTANYDALLIGWDAQSVQEGMTPNFGSSKYTGGGTAAAARANLISSDGWTITDGGIA